MVIHFVNRFEGDFWFLGLQCFNLDQNGIYKVSFREKMIWIYLVLKIILKRLDLLQQSTLVVLPRWLLLSDIVELSLKCIPAFIVRIWLAGWVNFLPNGSLTEGEEEGMWFEWEDHGRNLRAWFEENRLPFGFYLAPSHMPPCRVSRRREGRQFPSTCSFSHLQERVRSTRFLPVLFSLSQRHWTWSWEQTLFFSKGMNGKWTEVNVQRICKNG